MLCSTAISMHRCSLIHIPTRKVLPYQTPDFDEGSCQTHFFAKLAARNIKIEFHWKLAGHLQVAYFSVVLAKCSSLAISNDVFELLKNGRHHLLHLFFRRAPMILCKALAEAVLPFKS
jgi:hypothetical protein